MFSIKLCFKVSEGYANSFLSPWYPKSDMDEVEEVVFQAGEWSLDLILCLLDVLKCDFGDVDEAMIQGVERPCELIFCIQYIQKRVLVEVTEVIFQVAEWSCEPIICFPAATK
jgi:hypothetical protein